MDINEISQMDTFLWADGVTSKFNDDDNTEILTPRNYTRNMEALIEKISALSEYGIDNSTDETITNTNNVSVNLRFICDIVKNIIINHTKDSLIGMSELLKYKDID